MYSQQIIRWKVPTYENNDNYLHWVFYLLDCLSQIENIYIQTNTFHAWLLNNKNIAKIDTIAQTI